VFEGDQVADQRVEQARKDLAQLKTAAKHALAVPEFEALQGDVHSLLGALSQRIFTVAGGNSCGIGKDSAAIIANIRQRLAPYSSEADPFPIIPFTTQQHDCTRRDELQAISKQYDLQAERVLATTTIYRTKDVARRQEASQKIETSLDSAMLGLSQALNDSSESARGVARNYRLLQKALKDAADAYRQQIGLLESITSKPPDLPQSLDIEDVEQLGNIAYIIKNVLGRLDRPQTYFYILAAVLLDAFMVWAFTALIGDMAIAARGTHSRSLNRGDAEVRVQYLWTHGQS
jgi:hypothetical protein